MKITLRKILIIVIAIAVLVVGGYQGYLTVRYRLHNGHLDILSEPLAPEEARPFTPLAGTSVSPSLSFSMPMTPVAENEYLILFVDESTGNAAVYDKRDGAILYAVPPGAATDENASTLNQNLLRSQLTLEFFTPHRLLGRLNSHADSVEKEQFRIESITDGFRVVYTLGDVSSPTGIVPVFITPERLEQALAPLYGTREHTRTVVRYIESTEIPGHLELIETARRAPMTLIEMNEIFESAGYTHEDFMYDMEGSGVEFDIPLHFVVPLDFRLDGDSIVASINTAGIVEAAGGRIERIQLLRAFGAGDMDDNGYIVVPNGSGSLIFFNNQKTHADEYVQHIYDVDLLITDYVTLGNTEPARLPFFGIRGENHSVLARVTSGAAITYLTAGVSGRIHSFNYIYPTFMLRGSMSLAMFGATGNEAIMPVVERNLPITELKVRYSLLPRDNGCYSSMAIHAREQLIADGTLRADTIEPGDLPFYMNLVGSVLGQRFFAGVSYMGQIPMTTFEQAAEISEELRELGIYHQVINYQGWFNRGFYHDVADRIRPVRQLGSVSTLEELSRTLEEEGGKLYSDTIFMSVPWNSRRYRWQLESSRYYGGGMVAGFGLVSPITMFRTFSLGYDEVWYNPISPRFLTRYVDSFVREFERFDLTGVSLRDMGDRLTSDRRRTGLITREQAKEVVVHNLDTIENMGRPMMIYGGNLYALRFADDLIGAPLSHNAFYIIDEEIPFFHMIISGRIPYAGQPINFSDAFDIDEIVLRLVEFGAAPIFTFTYERATEMKYTGVNWMYATHFNNWRDIAAQVYHAVNDALSPVIGAEMNHHEVLENGLRRITYSNGVQIVINRTANELTLDGETVPPTGFVVIGGHG